MRVPYGFRLLFLAVPCVLLCFRDAGAGDKPKVLPGIDVLRKEGFEILKGKRVGLITNPTGIASDFQTTVDILAHAPGVQLVALFGPEHGVRGDAGAGARVEGYVDLRTGLPVYSLYGRTHKPTPEMLKGLDALVYDIQDIGVRSYTYISTMGEAMEAAAEQGIEFIVLDRPDPLTGTRVEGAVLDTAYRSFVGRFPIPYVYGMTAGELAQMVNGEGWLDSGRTCKLTVVPMEGWKRSMWWDDTGLPWVLTSPHIPHSMTPAFYVMTGLLGELGTANQGVGYTLPFELIGAPWVDGYALAGYLNGLGLGGVVFRPLSYKPFYFDTSAGLFHGVQVHIVDRERLNMTEVELSVLQALIWLFPESDILSRARPGRIRLFDIVNGSSEIRTWLESSVSVQEMLRRIDEELAQFKVRREEYLLYE